MDKSKIKVSIKLPIAFCFLLSTPAFAQAKPDSKDVFQDIYRLRVEISNLKNPLTLAISNGNIETLLSKCGDFNKEVLDYSNNFYSTRPYAKFVLGDQNNLEEQYLASSLLALSEAMGDRNTAVNILCVDVSKNKDKSYMYNSLSLLASAFSNTQSAEIFQQISNLVK